jgi:hypothetical protein
MTNVGAVDPATTMGTATGALKALWAPHFVRKD